MKLLKTTTSKLCDAIRTANGGTHAINIAVVSDIHLGHPRTSTFHIVANLRNAFPDNEETAQLDLIFLAGDVFDRLLTLPQEEVDEIQAWINELLALCAKHNILLRVLEGTPSHDWKQSRQFVNLNSDPEALAQLKYVETLSIETIDELGGLTVLYVPDEWNHDATDTWLQVQELLKKHGLDKVDVACMHGAFDYQLPIESIKNHNSAWYQSIVNHYIVIGHVHIRTTHGKILAQGSFDRLSHGEEAPKGHYRFSIAPEGNKHWFVENKGAKLYLTVDCRELTLAKLIQHMQSVEDYPTGTAFRFLIRRDSELHRDVREIRKQFPQFKITTQLDELKVPDQLQLRQTLEHIEQPISITPTNIEHLIKLRLPLQMPDAEQHRIDHVLATLEKYKFQGAP
jgi:DNA repair exonuclease SbcCD nuclease subunit